MSWTAPRGWHLGILALAAGSSGCSSISASGSSGSAEENCLYCPTGGATTLAPESLYYNEADTRTVPDPCLPPSTPVVSGGWGFPETTFNGTGTQGEMTMQLRIYPIPHMEPPADVYDGAFVSAHLVLLPDEIQTADAEDCKKDSKEVQLCVQQKAAEPQTYRYSGAFVAPVALVRDDRFFLPLSDFQTRTCSPHVAAFYEEYEMYIAGLKNASMVSTSSEGKAYGTDEYDAITGSSIAVPPLPTQPIPAGNCIIDSDLQADPWLTRFRWNGMMVKPNADPNAAPEFVVAPDGTYALWVEATSAEGQTGSYAIAKFVKGPAAGTHSEVIYFQPGLPSTEAVSRITTAAEFATTTDETFGGVADLRVNWRPVDGGDPCTGGPPTATEVPTLPDAPTGTTSPDEASGAETPTGSDAAMAEDTTAESAASTDNADSTTEEEADPAGGFNPFGL